MHEIRWNGVSSNEFNLILDQYTAQNRPERKYEKVSVAGRNGDLYFYQDAWENYDQEYQCLAGGEHRRVDILGDRIFDWLCPKDEDVTINDYRYLTLNGYHTLWDSNEPNCIRLATYPNATEFLNRYNHFGRATLRFSCRPERFIDDAFQWVQIVQSGDYVYNPTSMDAKPFVKVTGTKGSVVINGYVIDISDIKDYLYIDCDSQNCFRELAENRNSTVTLTSGFPVLSQGKNVITYDSTITAVEFVPRWWTL